MGNFGDFSGMGNGGGGSRGGNNFSNNNFNNNSGFGNNSSNNFGAGNEDFGPLDKDGKTSTQVTIPKDVSCFIINSLCSNPC